MKHIIFILLLFFVNHTLGQAHGKRLVENAYKVSILIPLDSIQHTELKRVGIMNLSNDRVITVRVEKQVMINNYLEKKIIEICRILPKERRFIGYSGCESNVLGDSCYGYKILLSYYDDKRDIKQ